MMYATSAICEARFISFTCLCKIIKNDFTAAAGANYFSNLPLTAVNANFEIRK